MKLKYKNSINKNLKKSLLKNGLSGKKNFFLKKSSKNFEKIQNMKEFF